MLDGAGAGRLWNVTSCLSAKNRERRPRGSQQPWERPLQESPIYEIEGAMIRSHPIEDRSFDHMHNEILEIDEQGWIDAARHGDLEAFNRLIFVYRDRAFQLAYHLLTDPMDAEDAVQDAMISAYLALPTYRGGSFRSWLFRIVTNRCLDDLRRRKRRPVVSFWPKDDDGQEIESPDWAADPGDSPEDSLLQSELSRQIQSCLEQLPQDQRTILVLVDMLGMSYEEAARVAGYPLGTVKSRLARARVQIRSDLREHPLAAKPVFRDAVVRTPTGRR